MKTYLKWTLIIAGLFFVFAVYQSEKARLDSMQQSALGKELFCKKYDSEKHKIIVATIDSLKDAEAKIIKNYFLLGQLENEVSTREKVLLSHFEYDFAKLDEKTCRAMLKALSAMESEKYLKNENNAYIKSFIPILNFDKVGKVKSIVAEIKYSNGKVDTVTDNTIPDFQSLVSKLKFDKSKRERDSKVRTQKIEYEKKLTPSPITYSILDVSRNNKYNDVGFVVSVRISNKLSNTELESLAQKVKEDIKAVSNKGVVFFLLPEMVLDNGAWAAVDFTPDKRVRIIGQSIAEEQEIKLGIENITDYVGLWADNETRGAIVIRIRKDKMVGYLFEFISPTDPKPSNLATPLIKKTENGKTIFKDTEHPEQYFLLKEDGDLSVYDNHGLVVTYKRLK